MDKGLFATFHWRWQAAVHALAARPVAFQNRFVQIRNDCV